MELAAAIATSPALAIQGTVRAAWLGQETLRRDALMQVSMLVSAGTDHANIESGQEAFLTKRTEPDIR